MQSEVQFVTDKQRLRPKDSEVFRLWGDNTLIKSLTGWQSEYSIEKGLKETIDWYCKPDNLKNYKANQESGFNF